MNENQHVKHVKKNSIILYGDYLDLVERLPLEERGRLLTALLAYAREEGDGEARFGNTLTDLVYTVIMGQLRRDRERYLEICEANRARANARWKAQSAQSAEAKREKVHEMAKKESSCPACTPMPTHADTYQAMPRDAERCYNDTDTDTETDNDTDNDTDTVTETEAETIYTPPIPPLSRGNASPSACESLHCDRREQLHSDRREQPSARAKRRQEREQLRQAQEANRTFTIDDIMRVTLNSVYRQQEAKLRPSGQ